MNAVEGVDKAPDPSGRPRGGATRWVLAVIGVIAIGVCGWLIYTRTRGMSIGGAPAASGSAAPERIVPVVVVTVDQRDMPIFLEGLGNVAPIASVLVRSQVDGRLDKVAFVEGQRVKKGELLAQIDPRPYVIQLHTAEAAIARDGAQWRNAKLNLDRFKTLRAQNLIPQQQVDDQQTQVDQFAGTLKGDETQAETARLLLDYARIVSPIDGVTGIRLVDPGNLIHATDATGIVMVTQLDPIAVLFTLPEDDLPAISKQLAAGPIAVDAYGRDGVKLLGRGDLLLVDNQINATTATIKLKAKFANPERALWPNEFVKARLMLTTRQGALVVPSTVVQRGPQGTFAYVVGADRTVSMRTVEIDVVQGEWTIIARGLSAGEQVVSDGQNQLKPGSKIAPRASVGAPPPPPAGASAAPSASTGKRP